MDKLISILEEVKPGVNFNEEKALIDNGVLDSFDIVQLIMKLNEEYDIEIGAEDINPANFNSAESILNLINSL